VKLRRVTRRIEGGRVRLCGDVERAGGSCLELRFSFDAADASLVADTADAFVPALLLPAMAAGEALEIVPEVSPLLLQRLPRLQAIFSSWFPRYRTVAVSAAPHARSAARAPGVGAFFSGGVDSFYTLRAHLGRGAPDAPAVTHLVFFHGLETSLAARRGGEASEARARAVAAETGLAFVAGETDLRTHFPLPWGEYCGAGLASAAHALSAGLGHVLVPSTDSYGDAIHWGSHPLVDELWSSECTAVACDGAELTRAGKVERFVALDPLARRHLRVCVDNAGGDFNCGRCHKCVRTMVALRALGVETEFETFPNTLPSDLDAALANDDTMFLEQNLALLERTGHAPALAAGVRRVLRARRRRIALRSWLENSPLAPLLPALRAVRGRRWSGRRRSAHGAGGSPSGKS